MLHVLSGASRAHPHGEHQEEQEPLDVLEHHHERVHKGELGRAEHPARAEGGMARAEGASQGLQRQACRRNLLLTQHSGVGSTGAQPPCSYPAC